MGYLHGGLLDKDERHKLAVHRHRAKTAGLDNSLTTDEWESILRAWNYTCVHCGQFYEEIDHLVPISQGGSHTADNVAPSCRDCNRRKGSETWSIPAKQLKLW